MISKVLSPFSLELFIITKLIKVDFVIAQEDSGFGIVTFKQVMNRLGNISDLTHSKYVPKPYALIYILKFSYAFRTFNHPKCFLIPSP